MQLLKKIYCKYTKTVIQNIVVEVKFFIFLMVRNSGGIYKTKLTVNVPNPLNSQKIAYDIDLLRSWSNYFITSKQ